MVTQIKLGNAMKSLLSVAAAASLALSFSATASNLETIEGSVSFVKGDYYLVSDKNTKQRLTGLNRQELRAYEGKNIKVAGETKSDSVEIYKIFVKTENGYEASYDWDVVNQELYNN